MNFRQIATFRAVMLTGSMTVAARELHTSQSNVSRAVAHLQRETGFRLFERSGLRVVPTPEAHALLREVDRSYVGLASIEEAASRIRTYGVNGLRLAVSPALAISLIPRALAAFRARRPGVPVAVSTADSATICRWTASGACDFGISASVAQPQEVNAELLHSQAAVCIVPTGHRLSNKRKVKPADLSGEVFISMPTYDPARHAVDSLFDPETRKLEIETSQASTICVMVARGLGVSIVNPLLLRELALVDVRAIAFSPDIPFRSYVIRAKHRPEQASVGDFLDAVRLAIEAI